MAQGLPGQPRGLAALGFGSRLGTGTKRFLPEAVRPFRGLCPHPEAAHQEQGFCRASRHCCAPPAAVRPGHISAPTRHDFLSRSDFLSTCGTPWSPCPGPRAPRWAASGHPGSGTGLGPAPGCQHGAGCCAPEQGASSSPPRVGERGVGRAGRGVPGAFGLPLGPASPRSAGSPRVMGRWAAFARSCLCVTVFLFVSLFGKFASPPVPLQCPAVGLEGAREGRWKRGLNRFDFPIPAWQRGLQAPGVWVLKPPWHRLGSRLVAGHLPPYSSPAPAQGVVWGPNPQAWSREHPEVSPDPTEVGSSCWVCPWASWRLES